MLTLASDAGIGQWDGGAVRRLVEIQRQVLGYRRERLDTTTGFSAAARHLLARVDAEHARVGLASPSTVHTSAADDGGLACSLTASAGYGSGVMPPGTGLWLNNCLGELELNGAGYHAWSPGQRLPSNMAPSVACRPDGTRLAIGSPGADRITTAILQTLVNFVVLGMPLTEAVDHPRLHLERGGGTWRVAYERGLPMEAVDLPTRAFEPPAMFFGGVTAALHRPGRGFTVAGDVRRRSGTRVAAAPPG
jgi:gamma-glutamyltranspeptidase/glutathione hydrolase